MPTGPETNHDESMESQSGGGSVTAGKSRIGPRRSKQVASRTSHQSDSGAQGLAGQGLRDNKPSAKPPNSNKKRKILAITGSANDDREPTNLTSATSRGAEGGLDATGELPGWQVAVRSSQEVGATTQNNGIVDTAGGTSGVTLDPMHALGQIILHTATSVGELATRVDQQFLDAQNQITQYLNSEAARRDVDTQQLIANMSLMHHHYGNAIKRIDAEANQRQENSLNLMRQFATFVESNYSPAFQSLHDRLEILQQKSLEDRRAIEAVSQENLRNSSALSAASDQINQGRSQIEQQLENVERQAGAANMRVDVINEKFVTLQSQFEAQNQELSLARQEAHEVSSAMQKTQAALASIIESASAPKDDVESLRLSIEKMRQEANEILKENRKTRLGLEKRLSERIAGLESAVELRLDTVETETQENGQKLAQASGQIQTNYDRSEEMLNRLELAELRQSDIRQDDAESALLAESIKALRLELEASKGDRSEQVEALQRPVNDLQTRLEETERAARGQRSTTADDLMGRPSNRSKRSQPSSSKEQDMAPEEEGFETNTGEEYDFEPDPMEDMETQSPRDVNETILAQLSQLTRSINEYQREVQTLNERVSGLEASRARLEDENAQLKATNEELRRVGPSLPQPLSEASGTTARLGSPPSRLEATTSRDEEAPTATALYGFVWRGAPPAEAERPFTRNKATTLHVPRDEEEKVKRLGARINEDGKFGRSVYVPANVPLEPFKEFWNQTARLEYRDFGQETFKREKWTNLDLEPGDPQWAEVKAMLGVREFVNGDVPVLTVAPNVNVLPMKDFLPKWVRDEYDAARTGRSTRRDTATTSRDEEAPTATALYGFVWRGAPPAEAERPFTRNKATTLHVPRDEEEKVKRLGARINEDGKFGRSVYVPANVPLEPFKEFWNQTARLEYRDFGQETFKREKWTNLDLEPGDPQWAEVKAMLGVREFVNGDVPVLTVAPNVNVLPMKDFLPKWVRDEYDAARTGRSTRRDTATTSRDEEAPTATALYGFVWRGAPPAEAERPFTRNKATTLHVPRDEEEKVKRLGARINEDGKFGRSVYVPANVPLEPFKEFWNQTARLEYRDFGQETFKREKWTNLDLEPGDPQWAEVKAMLGVREFVNGDVPVLTVAPNVNVLPMKDFLPKWVRDEYDAARTGRSTRRDTATTSRDEEAPTATALYGFVWRGAPPAEAERPFTRNKATTLHVPRDEEEKVKRLGARINEDGKFGRSVYVPANVPLEPFKEFWNQTARLEYRDFGEETFKRDNWTKLNIKSGDPRWQEAKAMLGVREFVGDDGPVLKVPKGVNVLPMKDFLPDWVRTQYQMTRQTALSSLTRDEQLTPSSRSANQSTARPSRSASTPSNSVAESTDDNQKFVRRVRTLLNVKQKDWDAVSQLPNVQAFEGKLSIPANTPMDNIADMHLPRSVREDLQIHNNRKRNAGRTGL